MEVMEKESKKRAAEPEIDEEKKKKSSVNTVYVLSWACLILFFLSHPQPYFSYILLSPRSFVWIRWPLRWLVSLLCTEGLALSPVYIKAVFTGLITRIRAPFLLCGAEGWSPL